MIPIKFSKDQTVVIIASGPSLTKEDVEYCRGKAVIAAVNDAWRLVTDADMIYAADRPWWDQYCKEHRWRDNKIWPGVLDLPGTKWTQDKVAADKYEINFVPGRWNPGISDTREYIHYGFNSGFQCLNLVYLMGARRIILLGFDFKTQKVKRHWFGDHPRPLHRDSDYGKWAHHMEGAAKQLSKRRVEIINCSRETAIKGFQRDVITNCL